jgi:predicted TIM-barrel fold metal-dependent hydrolase
MEVSDLSGDIKIINCHTHIFTSDHVPDKFLPLRLVRWLARKRHFRSFAWFFNNLNPFSNNDILDRYISFVRQGLHKTQKDILKILMDFYPPETKFVILTMDMKWMKAGVPDKSYEEQCDEIVRLLPEYGSRIYPFLFADPRRDDLLDFVKKYINMGFKGIKIYPSLGYFPFDPALYPVYEYAVANSIPITTHCSPGGVITKEKIRNLPVFHPITREKMKWKEKGKFVDNFTHPDNFRVVLDRYPNLKICFAHFGGLDEMEKYLQADTRGAMDETWFQKVKGLLRDFPNTFADISFTKIDMSLIPLINATIRSPKYRERILYGTDFYMNKIEGNELRFSISMRDSLGEDNFEQIAVKNPVRFLA